MLLYIIIESSINQCMCVALIHRSLTFLSSKDQAGVTRKIFQGCIAFSLSDY